MNFDNLTKKHLIVFATLAFILVFIILFLLIVPKQKNVFPNCKFLEKHTSDLYGIKAKIASIETSKISDSAYSSLPFVKFEPIDGIELTVNLSLEDMRNKNISNLHYNISNLEKAKEIKSYLSSISNLHHDITYLKENEDSYEFIVSSFLSPSTANGAYEDSLSFGILKKGQSVSQIQFTLLGKDLNAEFQKKENNNSN